MILLTNLFLLKTIENQPRLTQTARRNKCNIASISKMTGKQSCFLYPVTEIFWCQIALYNKRISMNHKPLHHYAFNVTKIS